MLRGSKRGVSPLIATVLLIAFAVALGAVVMSWGTTYVQETAASVRDKSDRAVQCSQDVSLKVHKISSTEQLCYGGSEHAGFVAFTLFNDGRKDIKQVHVNVFGKKNIQSNNSLNGTSMAVGQAMKYNLTYSYTTYGAVDQVQFVPVVSIGGIDQVCGGNALEKASSQLRNCSA